MTNNVAQLRKTKSQANGMSLSAWIDAQKSAALAGKPLDMTVHDIEAVWSPRFKSAEIEELVIPRRTLARRKASATKLTQEEADRAFVLARIQIEADRVFGNPEKASKWLRKENRRLHGQTPLAVLKTAAGADLVSEMLVQIDHGIFV